MRREVCEDILLLGSATNDHHNGLAKMVNGNEERRFVDSRFRYHLHQILIIQLKKEKKKKKNPNQYPMHVCKDTAFIKKLQLTSKLVTRACLSSKYAA